MNAVTGTPGDSANRRPPPAITFVAPALPAVTIRRERLQRLLGSPGANGLSLVTGPPGSGKTTLARIWIESVTSPVTWVTVDRFLGPAERFWPAVVVGIQGTHSDVVLDAVDTIGVEYVDGQAVAETLVDDLLRWPTGSSPVIVVVDDAHLLDADSWHALDWLIHHRPPQLHLMLLSRSDPPFSIARLRAQGSMSEVRGVDLALDATETAELVGRETPDGENWSIWSGALHQKTDGWVAGLRLALQTIGRGTAPERVLAQIGNSGGVIAELLATEALDSQPAYIREFLQRTSCLDLIDPALCNVVTGRDDSRTLLRRLAADHLFVVPLDGDIDRFRYHPLLAEILRLELRATDPDAEQEIHRLAATWMLEHDRLAPAIDHAVAGGHFDLAFEIITDNLRDLYAQGHRHDVASWLLQLPDTYLLADPDRTVEHCGALLFVVRPEWIRWLRRALAIVPDDRVDLRSRVQLFQALAWAGQGSAAEFERCVADAQSLRGPESSDVWDEVVAAWAVRLLTLRGDHEAAVRSAIEIQQSERRLISDLPALSLLAATLDAAGDPAGLDLALQAVAEWRAIGEPDFLGMADALCVAADAALRSGDLDEAENLATSAVAISENGLPNLITTRSEIVYARVCARVRPAVAVRDRLGALRATLVDQSAAKPVLDLVSDALSHLEARGPNTAQPQTAPLVDPLTTRELTILSYLASHLTFPEIASELYISRHTVKTHVARIYRKLGVSGRSAAVNAARSLGLLEPATT